MNYMLCCNPSTLLCTSKELESKIADFSKRYYKLSDSLWLYSIPKYATSDKFMSPDEYLFINILDKYITSDSVILTFPLSQKANYELPPDAIDFLSMDESDDTF